MEDIKKTGSNILDNLKKMEAAIEELNEYRSIGTIEEFRALKKLSNRTLSIVNGIKPKDWWED